MPIFASLYYNKLTGRILFPQNTVVNNDKGPCRYCFFCKRLYTDSQSNGPYLLDKFLSICPFPGFTADFPYSVDLLPDRRYLSSSIFALMLQRLEYLLRCFLFDET